MKKYFYTIFFAMFIVLAPAVVSGNTGDANLDGLINIIDALLTAQYYVGLDVQNFDIVAADSNCDGSVNIVDALIIAQYYVGLISEFEGCIGPEPTGSVPTPTDIPTGTETTAPTNVPYSDSEAYSVMHPTEMFSHTIGWGNGFDSWSITYLPSWLSAPKADNGAYGEPVTFRVDWSQINVGRSVSWNVVFTIEGEPAGKTEYILRVTVANLDPNPTPTPVIDGTPMPTLPAMITFEGYVYDADTYTPVSGAEITLTVEGRTTEFTSEPNGHYFVGLPVGFRVPAELTISGANFAPQSYSFPDIMGSYSHDFPVEINMALNSGKESTFYTEQALFGYCSILAFSINKQEIRLM